MTDLDKLDALAAAATPGPWTAFIDDYGDGDRPGTMFITADPQGAQHYLATGMSSHDAAFIVACDPATIRDLVAAAQERDELRDIILNGGLRLPGFDHWRERASSKPSDPDDVRWDCSCGYSGAPEKVQKHWAALHREAEA